MYTQFFNLRRRAHSSLRWLPALILSSALTPLLPLNATPAYAAGRANNPAIQADAHRQPSKHVAGAVCGGVGPIGGTCAPLASPHISLLGAIKCPEGYAPIGGTCVPVVPQASLLGDFECPEGYAPIGGTCMRIGASEGSLPGEVGCEGYAPIGGTSICENRLGSMGPLSNNG